MSTEHDNSVIQKKAMNGREDFDARAMSWSKALRLSLERCADAMFQTAMVVRAVEQISLPLDDLKPYADGDKLIMLLDGCDGAKGSAILDRGLAQAVVEAQTRGTVSTSPLSDRPFTATDAAVTIPLLDAVLSSLDTMMADSPSQPHPLELRFDDRVPDTRSLILALDAPDFELFRLSIDIGNGARMGELTLVVPEHMLRPEPVADPDTGGEPCRFDLSEQALSAPVPLDAVLTRLQMPLSQVCTLKPGAVLPVSQRAIGQAELVGAKGFLVAKVALGKMNGNRAVRIGAYQPGEGRQTYTDGSNRPARRTGPAQDDVITPDNLTSILRDKPDLPDAPLSPDTHHSGSTPTTAVDTDPELNRSSANIPCPPAEGPNMTASKPDTSDLPVH